MLILVWGYIVEFVRGLISKGNFKGLLLLLVSFLIAIMVYGINKVSDLNTKFDAIPQEIKKENVKFEKRINAKIEDLYIEGLGIFKSYTKSNNEDLQTIIDYSNIPPKEASLIKRVIEKSNTRFIQEVEKKQIERKIKMDSLKIVGSTLSFYFQPYGFRF
jgi:hypothetical protein